MAFSEPTRRPYPHQRLTDRTVTAHKVPGRYADGDGLYLVVEHRNSKSWMLRTTVQGRRRDIALGSARHVRLAEAREEARRLQKIAKTGGDPLAERQRPSLPTFEAAARQYHETLVPSFKTTKPGQPSKHGQQWLASLTPFFKACGTKRVDAVTKSDLLTVLQLRWLSHAETSSRILQRVRAIFEWCEGKGYRSGDNPTNGLKKVLPKQTRAVRHRPSLPYEEVPAFLRALSQSEAGVLVQLALEFLVLTCTRTKELLGAQWEEVDFPARTWTVPAIRMKYGGIPHRVPLSSRCLQILEQARTLSPGSPYVFLNPQTQQPFSNMVFLMATRRMTKTTVFVPSRPYVLHGFRSSYRDWAEEEQTHVAHVVKEAVLAHKTQSKTEAAYLRTDLFTKRRDLMEAWAGFATATPAKVIAFRA